MSEPIPMEVLENPEEVDKLLALHFPKSVLSDIAKKRSRLESKLAIPTKENYVEYIELEKRLLSLVEASRERVPGTLKNLKTRMVRRINRLYKELLSKFGNDYQDMKDYFKFCVHIKAKIRAKEIVELILQHHSANPGAWSLAISWFVQMHSNESKIREIASKALLKHPQSQKIYNECFHFELKNLENAVKLSEGVERQLEITKTFIDRFFHSIKDQLDYYFEVLEIFDKYDGVNIAVDYFIQKMQEGYKEEPLFWDSLVRRELKAGNNVATNTAIYENGIASVPNDKKPELWGLYLKYLLDFIESKEDSDEQVVQKEDLQLVDDKFKQAHEDSCLPEDFYFFWYKLNKKMGAHALLTGRNMEEIRTEMHEKDCEILAKGLQRHPTSVKLWNTYFCNKMDFDDSSDEIPKIFEQAVSAVKDNVELWVCYVKSCMQTKDNGYIQSIFERAVKASRQVADELIPEYLEWLWMNCGREVCRNAYDNFVVERHHCRKMHKKMLKLEFMEFRGVCDRWERVFRNAIEQFPHDVDFWVDYMQFSIEYKRCSKEAISALYERAMNTLPDFLQLLFQQRMSTDES